MSIETQFQLQRNPMLKQFLHENPKYYKFLNREPGFIKQLNTMMREKYKLTLPDKMNVLKDKLDMVNTFIDILN